MKLAIFYLSLFEFAEEGTLDECVFEYPGSRPFSEVEAKAVADFLQATPSISFYVAVHSYGMVIGYFCLSEVKNLFTELHLYYGHVQ